MRTVNFSKSFDEHWSIFSVNAIPRKKIAEAGSFLGPVVNIYKDKRIFLLDAGCGDCVHAEALKNHRFSRDSIFVGLDISLSGMRLAKQRNPDWSLINANILKLPFIDKSFDVIFSFGVLGYTNSPYNSFLELCRVTKQGGLVGVWIYPKREGVLGYVFKAIRSLCRISGSRITRLIGYMIVPFLGLLPTESGVSLKNSTWNQCLEVVLVSIAPTQLFFFEEKEVENWFKQNNIEIVYKNDNKPITIWGIKR